MMYFDGNKGSFSYVSSYKKLIFPAALLYLTILCGCGAENAMKEESLKTPKDIPNGGTEKPVFRNHEGLSEQLERQIRQDYLDDLRSRGNGSDYTINDVLIAGYYGTYNDCVIVMMSINNRNQPFNPMLFIHRVIADTLFHAWPIEENQGIRVWRARRFFNLNDAYNMGILTFDDIRSIAYIYNNGEMNLENHAGLDFSIIRHIARDYFYDYIRPHVETEEEDYLAYLNYDIRMTYYGYYDSLYGSIAVMMSSKYDDYDDIECETTIAGTPFRWRNGNRILIWNHVEGTRGGHFYELQEAYDLGLLSGGDVSSIAYYHKNNKTISYSNN